MPRYFFHIRDGHSAEDDTGTELTTLREAQLEAIRLAGCVIKDDAANISTGEDWRLEVTDQTGHVLFRFEFLSGDSAAGPAALRFRK